jgi:hypothetical protein
MLIYSEVSEAYNVCAYIDSIYPAFRHSVEIFWLVTGHGTLCRSVESELCVTVTGVCRIDRNGTVLRYRDSDPNADRQPRYILADRSLACDQSDFSSSGRADILKPSLRLSTENPKAYSCCIVIISTDLHNSSLTLLRGYTLDAAIDNKWHSSAFISSVTAMYVCMSLCLLLPR